MLERQIFVRPLGVIRMAVLDESDNDVTPVLPNVDADGGANTQSHTASGTPPYGSTAGV